MRHRERFAPSPSGLLHLGHAYSALVAWDRAQQANGEFLLRIEDIDTIRSKPEYEQSIYEDLRWLGLDWPEPVVRQSERLAIYQSKIKHLSDLGVCYPCRCSRKDIRLALSAPQERDSDDIVGSPNRSSVYPGTCRNRPMSDISERDAIRLNIDKAISHMGGEGAVGRIEFEEIGESHSGIHRLNARHLTEQFGDIVLARSDIGTSYNLAVVVDDAEQRITSVTRGEDLYEVTPIHRILQVLLDYPAPTWNHHLLIREENGKRLAKRDNSRSIANYRQKGMSREDIFDLVGFQKYSQDFQ